MTVYIMKHDSIEFSSTNEKQVEFYERILANTSASDVLLNKTSGRHQLMVNMGLAGHCPLSEDYFHARGVLYKERERFKDKCKGGVYSRIKMDDGTTMFVIDAAYYHAVDETKRFTGWDFN